MFDPQRPAPPERPDPSALLIDAVIQRQGDLAQRLVQQWVHRRGWPSLDRFVQGPLLSSCGPEALDWLRQRLGLETPTAVLREALAEAIAPLRAQTAAAALAADPATAPATPLAMAAVQDHAAADNPWTLPPLKPDEQLAPSAPAAATNTSQQARPAPPPADLAGLRAWLHSDAA